MAEDPRTTAARDNDDRDLIENAIADTAAGILPGSPSGLHHDMDTKAQLREAVEDPDGTTRPTKQDDIDNDQAYDSDRRGNSG